MTPNSAVDAFGSQLNNILSKIDYSPIIPTIQQIVDNSIQRNFNEGGRFGSGMFGGGSNKWKQSKRVSGERKINAGYGKTLIDTAQLVQSIRVTASQKGNRLVITAGSNKVYAAIHNFGGKTKNNKEIIARPFLVLQDEDVEQIMQVIMAHLAKSFLS